MLLTLAFALMLFPLATQARNVNADPPDQAGDAYALHREILSTRGVVGGDGEPGDHVSRETFATWVVALAGLEQAAAWLGEWDVDIADMEAVDTKKRGDVAALYAAELIGPGHFRPGDPVSVAEAVTVLLRTKGRDAERDAAYPLGPVAKAASLGLVEDWRLAHDAPADRAFLYEATAWVSRALEAPTVGMVGEVDDAAMRLASAEAGETEIPLADEVAVFGAVGLDAVLRQVVTVYRDENGDIAVVEAVEPVETTAGVIRDHRISRGALRVEEGWEDVGDLVLEVNGMPLVGMGAEEKERMADAWCEEGAEVSIHRGASGTGRVDVRRWDLDPVRVVCREEDALTLQHRGAGMVMAETVDASKWCGVSVSGAVTGASGIREGDVLRIASLGGMGFLEGAPPHAVRVHRDTVTVAPLADGYRRIRDAEGVRYRFDDVDSGEAFTIDPRHYLGCIEALRGAVRARVGLDDGGRGVGMVESTDHRDLPVVRFLEYGRDGDGGYVVRVETKEETLRLPSIEAPSGWIAGVSGAVKEQFFAPEFDREGMLAGMDRITPGPVDFGAPVSGEVRVAGVLEEHACVVLMAECDRGEKHYRLFEDPWVFDGTGERVSPEELEVDQPVKAYDLDGRPILVMD